MLQVLFDLKISTLTKVNKQLFGIKELIQLFKMCFLNSSTTMRTLIPSITVISFTSEDLIGFSSTGAKLQDDSEDEDEDVALRVLFLEEGATGGGGG